MTFEVKDSGERTEFSSGMVRDKCDDKTEYWSMRIGPMYRRWAELLTKGRKKYPDVSPGVPNWTLAAGEAELLHAKSSLTRHIEQYLAGDTDEDHAAAIFFNVNLIEYIKERLFEAQTGADAATFVDSLKEAYRSVRIPTHPTCEHESYGSPTVTVPREGILKPGAEMPSCLPPGAIIYRDPPRRPFWQGRRQSSTPSTVLHNADWR